MSAAPRVVRIVAFGIWTGAMVGFAFLFAPTAFSHVGPTPAFAATIADTIGKLTVLGYACAAIVLLASLPRIAVAPRLRLLVALAAIMCALGWYEVHAIVPLMNQTPLQTPAYDALHRRSSTIYSIILLLGLTGLLLTATEGNRISHREPLERPRT